jgi:hypothetical protein
MTQEQGHREPELPARAAEAFKAYLNALEEPPFDENHHRYHTPADGLETCETCVFRGWAGDSDERMFVAGYLAAARDAAADRQQAVLLAKHALDAVQRRAQEHKDAVEPAHYAASDPQGIEAVAEKIAHVISQSTLDEVERVGREYPDGVHTCFELQQLEPDRRPCTCGRCITIKHDSEVVAVVANSNAAFEWLLRHQGQSVDYAVRWGGYRVLDAGGTELPGYKGGIHG